MAALELYSQILEVQPRHFGALHFSGVVAAQRNRNRLAVELMGKSIEINARIPIALNNYGNALAAVGEFDAAIVIYGKAIELDRSYSDAYYNRGLALAALKRYPDAINDYESALSLQPEFEYLKGLRQYLKMLISDWADFEVNLRDIAAGIERGEAVSAPFPVLALTDSPILHMKAASIWAKGYPTVKETFVSARLNRHDRIRVGYFSADFRYHPVSVLMAGVFEAHDRKSFELIAFSYGPATEDETRKRIVNAFEHFVDVRENSDSEIAQLAKDMEVDIAVDLGGFTHEARTGIFANRAASIQISYLGYPGTLCLGYMDYLIGDSVLIPNELQQYYLEKIIYLPKSYQANDSVRPIATTEFGRAAFGLPEDAFVFCCFNSGYKITPGLFDLWMRILSRTEGSVLWLSETSIWATRNLRKEALSRNVDPNRLIFAKRLPSASEHLARHRLADLFLDTFPYNAHTTASDALWAGLPVLTRVGESFASRVGASLLATVGLSELVVNSIEQYEDLAVSLAADRTRLLESRDKLARNRLTSPLFDTPLFTKHLESAYTTVYERYHMGISPDHVYVQS